MITMSGSRLRYSAVSAPHKTPPTAANTSARMPSVAETGKWSPMMSLTQRFCCVNEMPKSPFSMFPR